MRFASFFEYPGEPSGGERFTLLPDWRDDDWAALLEHTETLRFSAGATVVRAGDAERALYVIAAGEVEVVAPHARHALARVQAGSVIGEVAFLDGLPRSADVRAVTDCEVLRLSHAGFEVFAARRPELAVALLADLGRLLAWRLRGVEELSTP